MTPAEARQKLGLSQERFAQLMGGTSVMTISKWETGQRNPTAQSVELMRLLVWMHDNQLRAYARWLKEI